jgi:hypothetical protein
MPNAINTIKAAGQVLAKAAAQEFVDNLKFCKSIAKADESDFDGKNGYKAGDTIQISKPARFIPQSGNFDITSTKRDIVEERTPLALDIMQTVGLSLNSMEEATELGLKSLINRAIRPAARSLAQFVEQDVLLRATQATSNLVGTAGSTSFTVADIQAAKVVMNENLCPVDDQRYLLLTARSGAAAVDARKGLFQASDEIAKQYKGGYIGMADSFNWMENELLYNHTNGNDVTGVNVSAAPSEGASTIALAGLTNTTGTVTKGSVFTIANVFRVHPITKQVTNQLQQFVVTANATANGSGVATVSVYPAFFAAAADGRRNIGALPAGTAAVVFSGVANTGYTQNLAFHGEAFRMASVPLMMPKNVEMAEQYTVDGMTVAIVQAFDVNKREMITRLDFLGGLAAVRPEWACRITS